MFFQYLLQKNFNYKFFCSINELQVPEAMVDMVALNSNQKHIQLLFKPLSYINISGMGHWVCSYYDTQNIFIYDSATIKTGHYKVLHKLFPSYFLKGGGVQYPNIHCQTPGSVDCGVYAIANAVSLHFGLNPEHIIYESIEKLREHHVKIFLSEIITLFHALLVQHMSKLMNK